MESFGFRSLRATIEKYLEASQAYHQGPQILANHSGDLAWGRTELHEEAARERGKRKEERAAAASINFLLGAGFT